MLKFFVKAFTDHQKYSRLNGDDLKQPVQTQLSQKQKTFSKFFSAILKSRLNFEHFQTMMTLIAEIFQILRTPKDGVR